MSNLLKRLSEEVPKPTESEFFKGSLSDYYKAGANAPIHLTSEKIDITNYELLTGKPTKKPDYTVFIQDGGVGDTICATAMFSAFKKTYPNRKLIVGTMHPDALLHNPNIDVLYFLGQPDKLYEEYVLPVKDMKNVICLDPYKHHAHRNFPGPLSMLWCYLADVPFYGDFPVIYLTKDEDFSARKFLDSFPNEVVIIHPYGAHLIADPKHKMTSNKDWFPDRWSELVKRLTKMGFDVIQVGGAFEPPIEGITSYLSGSLSLRQTFALIRNCYKFICVESLVGHAGSAVGKSGIVLFGRSNPLIFSHASNTNIFVKESCDQGNMHCGRPEGHFADMTLFRGNYTSWNCPTRACMKAITVDMVQEAFEGEIR